MIIHYIYTYFQVKVQWYTNDMYLVMYNLQHSKPRSLWGGVVSAFTDLIFASLFSLKETT